MWALSFKRDIRTLGSVLLPCRTWLKLNHIHVVSLAYFDASTIFLLQKSFFTAL